MFGSGAFARPGAGGQMLGGVEEVVARGGRTIPVIVGEGVLTYLIGLV